MPMLIIVTAVEHKRREELWGDTHFARDVARAMSQRGWTTSVIRLDQCQAIGRPADTAVLYLRGLREVPPLLALPTAAWVISHPATFDDTERSRIDLLFSASTQVADRFDGVMLPQGTDTDRFRPIDDTSHRHGFLFVANSRGQRRIVVDHAMRAGVDLDVYGRRWRRVYPKLRAKGRGIANDMLAAYYSGATCVLNDHWPDMARFGIVSNRIFDALSCGAPVLTDRVEGMDAELASHLVVYSNYDEFVAGAELVASMTEAERKTRGEAARRYVMAKHSFAARAEVLDASLRGLL